MKSGSSDEAENKFLRQVDEVIAQEKAFLTEIGRL